MTIQIDDDFDLYKIVYSGQCFRPLALPDGSYRFITKNHLLYIKELFPKDNPVFMPAISEKGPDLAAGINNNTSSLTRNFEISVSKEEWQTVWLPYFDLELNYEAIRRSIPREDDFLSKSADIGKGIRILKQDKFEMLISFIISQRKSIPAIKSSVDKLCRLFGEKIADDIYTFPSPETLAKAGLEDLKSCGLGYRIDYVKEAAKRLADKELNLDLLDNLSDEELLKALKGFYGVGDKVANCVMLFAYHRIGSAPIDTWISKIINDVYLGADPFMHYPGTAGIMQQYMFYAAQHMKTLEN